MPQSLVRILIFHSPSVEPREAYLSALLQLKQQLIDTIAIIDGRSTLERPKTHLEMPIETILRKYIEFTAELRSVTENNQSFTLFFNDLLERLTMIRTELSQTILRCSMGDANFKEMEHQLKVLEPDLEAVMDQHLRDKKHCWRNLPNNWFKKSSWTCQFGKPFRIVM